MNATPTKRRALGSLDVNVARSPRSPSSTKLAANKGLVGLGGSPLKKRPAGGNNIVVTNNSSSRHGTPSPSRKKTTPTKRPLLSVFSDDKENGAALLLPAAKRLCSDARVIVEDVDEDEPVTASQASARRSISPDASSLFDTPSAINTSQLTNITEPDTEAPVAVAIATAAAVVTTTATTSVSAPSSQPTSATTPTSILDTLASLPPPRSRRVPTREEFRKKAEILKLRLSLATYKVKTNQTDVPLDKLQIRPMPGMARRKTPLPSMSAHTIERATPVQYWYRSSARKPLPCHAPRNDYPSRHATTAKDNLDEDDEEDEIDLVEGDKAEGGTAREVDDEEEAALPKLSPSDAAFTTPRKNRNEMDEEKLTSSALRGGAAKGLLSLSQGSC